MLLVETPPCPGRDVSDRERRAGDRADPARRDDRSAGSPPRRGHHKGSERSGRRGRPTRSPGDAAGGQRQHRAQSPPELPGASPSPTGSNTEFTSLI